MTSVCVKWCGPEIVTYNDETVDCLYNTENFVNARCTLKAIVLETGETSIHTCRDGGPIVSVVLTNDCVRAIYNLILPNHCWCLVISHTEAQISHMVTELTLCRLESRKLGAGSSNLITLASWVNAGKGHVSSALPSVATSSIIRLSSTRSAITTKWCKLSLNCKPSCFFI